MDTKMKKERKLQVNEILIFAAQVYKEEPEQENQD